MADDTSTDVVDDTDDDLDDDAQGADDKAGDGKDGKKAAEKPLTAEEWQAKFEAQQRVNRDLERKTRRDKATLDKLTAAQAAAAKTADADEKVDVDKIKADAKAEATAAVTRDRVLDKIEAKAGAKFSLDPEDVAALVLRRKGVDEFVTADGKVDAEAIADALDDLLKAKPNLAAQGGKRFQGDADGGARGAGAKSLDQQIADAVKAGDVRLQIRLQNQKLLNQS